MTDKQIIIDGIDVSKCWHRQGITCTVSQYDFCDKHSNCYYKQLKRKEQELQEAMDNYIQLDLQRVKEYNELVDLYKAKEQECEELKKIINEAKSSSLDLQSFLVGEAVQNEYEQQLDQLKQILAKIKEICNSVENIENINSLYDAKLSGMFLQANKILQKISECEVKYEN